LRSKTDWASNTFDPLRQLVGETNANKQVTVYTYCSCGSPDTVTRSNGTHALTTTLAYDMAGRLTNTTFPDGYQINRAYDGQNRLTNVSDSGTLQLQLDYVNVGLLDRVAHVYLVSGTLGQQLLLANQFDEYGRVTNSIDRNGVTVTNAYDLLGRIAQRRGVDPSGALIAGLESFAYNSLGLQFHTNALGAVTSFGRDSAGRLLFETNAENQRLQFSYDPSDNLTTLIDGKLQQTAWRLDQYSRPTNKSIGGSVVFQYQYDPNGRLTNLWSAAKGNVAFRYDPIGNLTNIVNPSSPSITFAFDGLNRLTNMSDALGVTAFTWTDGGQLASETGPWASDALSLAYSSRLRTNLSLTIPSAQPWTQNYAYDEFQRLTNTASAAGAFSYQYAQVTAGNGSATAPDLVAQLQLPNGASITNDFDGLARLLSTVLQNSIGGALNSHQYTYDAGSQRSTTTRFDGSSVAFSYDNIGQLKVANSSVNSEDRGYAYDAAWNLIWRTNNTSLFQFVVTNNNELALANQIAVANDANGNQTTNGSSSYFYDDQNQLTRVSDETFHTFRSDFVYDGLGRLRKRLEYYWQNSQALLAPVAGWNLRNTVPYIYDGNRVVQERDQNNTPTVSYTRGIDLSGSLEGAGGIGGLLARSLERQLEFTTDDN
jgi:YD repeat-containing protein